jgi:TPR repeat protein
MIWRALSALRSKPQPAAPADPMAEAAAAVAREDYAAALAIWNTQAHAGNARAKAEIGRCFVNAYGVERNVGLAREWLTQSAKAGDPLGQKLLADFYFNGEDGTPDRAIAEEWYARAARQGEPFAQDMLSWILTEGDHRAPDYNEAMQWARKAADQGVAASMTRIGLLYNNALGVERDVEAATRWWRMAAMLDDPDGQAMLGAAYHIGAGVERDPVAALAWLIRARVGRSSFADRFYIGVRETCSPEQCREAEKRATLPLAFAEVVR